MLDMQEEYGYAYWVSGVLFWLCSCIEKKCDLFRYFKVQRKLRSLGYAIHEDIPDKWSIIHKQMGLDYNKFADVTTDLRHARFVDQSYRDWTKKELKICKAAAKEFMNSSEPDLTKWCRQPENKKKKLRERQLLIDHFLS